MWSKGEGPRGLGGRLWRPGADHVAIQPKSFRATGRSKSHCHIAGVACFKARWEPASQERVTWGQRTGKQARQVRRGQPRGMGPYSPFAGQDRAAFGDILSLVYEFIFRASRWNRVLTSSNRSGKMMSVSIRKKKKKRILLLPGWRGAALPAQHLVYPSAQLVYSALVVASMVLTMGFSRSVILKYASFQYRVLDADTIEQNNKVYYLLPLTRIHQRSFDRFTQHTHVPTQSYH